MSVIDESLTGPLSRLCDFAGELSLRERIASKVGDLNQGIIFTVDSFYPNTEIGGAY